MGRWLQWLPEGPTATYKMDDLETISLDELSLSPSISRHDVAIEFNRDAIRLHSKSF